MRLLVVVLAILGVAAVACGGGGGDSGGGGGGSSSSSDGGSSSAASDGNHCTLLDQLASHDGDTVLLCAEVASGEYLPDQKRNTVLYIGAPPPGQLATVVLEGAIRSSFLTAPEERFGQPGTLICAEGKVSTVDGVPQVFVNNAQNIVFLDELTVSGDHCNGAGTN
jgi:hypothetical protein